MKNHFALRLPLALAAIFYCASTLAQGPLWQPAGMDAMQTDRKVGIKTSAPLFDLDVNGSCRTTGSARFDSILFVEKQAAFNSDVSINGNVTVTGTVFASRVMIAEKMAADSSATGVAKVTTRLEVGGNATVTGNLSAGSMNVSGQTSFDSVTVQKKIKIGSGSLILEDDPGGLPNTIYTTPSQTPPDPDDFLYLQGFANSSNHTIINHNNEGNVGIGTILPVKKLQVTVKHLVPIVTNPDDPNLQTLTHQGIRLENQFAPLSNPSQVAFTNTWDMEPLGGRDFAIRKPNGRPVLFLKENGEAGINTTQPWARFSVLGNGNPKLISARVLFEEMPSNDLFTVYANGNTFISSKAGIGTETPEFPLHVKSATGTHTSMAIESPQGRFMWELQSHNTTGNFVLKLNVNNNPNTFRNVLTANVNGQVTIGTETPIVPSPHTDYKVAVDGKLISKSAHVRITSWGDYVFTSKYRRMTFDERKNYLLKNTRLPGMPSAAEIEYAGLDLGESMRILNINVEELNLYVLDLYDMYKEQNSIITILQDKMAEQQKQIDENKKQIDELMAWKKQMEKKK